MTESITRELRRGDDAEATHCFGAAAERVRSAEARYGWLQALNLQGSGGLANVGPIAVVVVAAFAGSHHAGTLVALYLLAQRVFWGFDGVIDLSLGTKSARGAVARCFDLIDTREGKSQPSPIGRAA